MRIFIRKLILFLIPGLAICIALELWARDNEYQVKGRYTEAHKEEVELMMLGSSQLHQAIHPDYQDRIVAPLVFGGCPMNMRIKLFDKFLPQFPRLKYVMLEVSAFDLEIRAKAKNIQNHLYWVHFGINNYETSPPLKAYFLLTANPKAHLKKAIHLQFKKPIHTAHGFPLRIQYGVSRFERLNYDSVAIGETSYDEFLVNIENQVINRPKFYSQNCQEIDELIEQCRKKGLHVMLISPPKYFLLNDFCKKLNPEKIGRRDAFLAKYEGFADVHVWNFEDWHAQDPSYFKEENHMSIKGAIAFSSLINEKIKQLEN